MMMMVVAMTVMLHTHAHTQRAWCSPATQLPPPPRAGHAQRQPPPLQQHRHCCCRCHCCSQCLRGAAMQGIQMRIHGLSHRSNSKISLIWTHPAAAARPPPAPPASPAPPTTAARPHPAGCVHGRIVSFGPCLSWLALCLGHDWACSYCAVHATLLHLLPQQRHSPTAQRSQLEAHLCMGARVRGACVGLFTDRARTCTRTGAPHALCPSTHAHARTHQRAPALP